MDIFGQGPHEREIREAAARDGLNVRAMCRPFIVIMSFHPFSPTLCPVVWILQDCFVLYYVMFR